jgi:hypothetical protein
MATPEKYLTRFRHEKTRLLALLSGPSWAEEARRALCDPQWFRIAANPLFALLARPETRWQAAWSLGKGVAALAREDMEDARVIMRRIMWGLNEDSGNLGWGLPESMGCILAESPPLAKEYHRTLLSYIHDTGKADNYLDHTPLRRGAYWAAGRLAAADPVRVLPALPCLVLGLQDEDIPCRGCSAFACKTLAAALVRVGRAPASEEAELWAQARRNMEALADTRMELTLLEGDEIVTRPIAAYAATDNLP